jgi:hypothetical protein
MNVVFCSDETFSRSDCFFVTYMILNTIGVSQLISFYQYVKNETNISQRAINNGRWSILLWYVVQHVIDRCRPHSLNTTSAAGVANLSGRPLSGPRTDGDQRVPPRTSRDATRRSAGCRNIFFPQNHRRRTGRARPKPAPMRTLPHASRPEHRGRETNKISPDAPHYFTRSTTLQPPTTLLGAPHCSL